MIVKIDYKVLGKAITDLDDLAGSISSAVTSAQNGTPISLPSLDGLPKKAAWLRDQKPMLSGLHDIAVLLAEKGSSVSSFSVGNSIKDIKTMLGQTLATKGQDVRPPADDDASKAYIALLEKWEHDPATMAAMQLQLGPEGTLRLLNTWADDPYDNNQVSDEQRRLVTAMKTSLQSATQRGGFTDTQATAFARGLVDQATTPEEDLVGRGTYNPSGALAYLLRDGHFGDTFIKSTMDDLDQYERQDNNGVSGLWGDRSRMGMVDFNQFMPYGDANTSGNLDPLASGMSAMANNPSVALDFFNNDDGKPPRSEYYIKERNWDQDNFDGISAALDTATTDPSLIHGSKDQVHDAAVLASKTVEYFSEREYAGDIPGMLARNPENGAAEDLAHILSTYMPAVDGALDNHDDITPGAGRVFSDAFNRHLDDVPVFDEDGLKAFTRMATATDQGLGELTQGMNEYRGQVLGSLADQVKHGADISALSEGIKRDARLQGYLVNLLGDDAVHDAHERDERTKATIDMLSNVVDLVPVPGMSHLADGVAKDAINLTIDTAKGSGYDALKESMAHAEDDTVSDYNDKAAATLQREQFTVASLLDSHELSADTGRMSPVTRPGGQIISYDDYTKLSDPDKQLVETELFSSHLGVGKVMSPEDYREAYLTEFNDPFHKEG